MYNNGVCIQVRTVKKWCLYPRKQLYKNGVCIHVSIVQMYGHCINVIIGSMYSMVFNNVYMRKSMIIQHYTANRKANQLPCIHQYSVTNFEMYIHFYILSFLKYWMIWCSKGDIFYIANFIPLSHYPVLLEWDNRITG